LADGLNFPLWLDSIGTSIVAALFGPLCGALCGGISNILIGLSNPMSFAYSSTNILIGVIVGYCVKKGWMDKLFGALSVGMVIATVAVVISVPLNCIFYEGYSGNMWGDGVHDMLVHYNFPSVVAAVAGELFVDFPDKMVSMMIAFAVRKISFKRQQKKGKAAAALAIILALSTAVFCPDIAARADTAEDYAAWYIPTIYNSENGLVGGAANDIAETSDGYIWVGTYAGLYRYDGIEFTSMDELDTVKNVNCLYVDEEGRLWIGTNDNGVSLYVKGSVSSVMNTASGLSSDSVRCIMEDSLGNYYVGTSDKLCVLTMENGLQVKKVIPEITYVSDISASEDGLVAVITNSGNFYLMKDGEILESYYPEGDDYYTSCEFLGSGQLLIGTSGNVMYEYEIRNQHPVLTGHLEAEELKMINAFQEDDNGNIWVCADNGIGYIDPSGKYRTFNVSNFKNSIDNIMVDYHGNLWFTSTRMGLLKLCESEFLDVYSLNGLDEAVVNSVTLWNGYCYSGTDVGLDIIDTENNRAIENELTERLSGQRIRCLKVDSKNQLWICTSNGEGLFKVGEDNQVTVYSTETGTIGNNFRSVLEMSDGTIVAAENIGLDFIRDGKVTATIGENDGLATPQVLSLLELPGKALLAGTDGGGIAVIIDDKVTGKIGMADGLTSGVILRMIDAENGVIAVTSNSLCYIDEEGQVTELDSFPYSNNYDMIAGNNGKIWILSSAGIYIADEKELVKNQELSLELLDAKKGLTKPLTANAWDYVDEAGNLYLSCTTGVYMVNMENYDQYEHSYRMMVEYLKADDETYAVNSGETTEITKDVKRIVIKPIIFNYTINDPYVSYYLEGFDDQPIVVKQSSLGEVIYTNLPSGEYTFRLSILDNSGENVIESFSYPISLEKQIWEYGWFRAYFAFVCILFVVYFTWLVTRLHMNHIIERQNQELAATQKQLQMGRETIQAIAATVDAKDEKTSQHSFRVAEYSALIAKRSGWSKEKCENLRQIALLHDIGKIGIPDSVLNKPGKLTDEEYEIMKSHVAVGEQILKDFTLIDNVAEGALYHHERFDGKGYVHGLKGYEIPVNARIIGIADAFDAMTSDRVYRKHMDMEYVIGELKKGSGTQFDPTYTEILLELIEDGTIDVEGKRMEAAT
jgi:energy-coupling factor transport system substrate-specific component